MHSATTANNTQTATTQPLRQSWQPPAIVLERSLEVSAQGGPPQPGYSPQGFLGPLGTSGGKGTCANVT